MQRRDRQTIALDFNNPLPTSEHYQTYICVLNLALQDLQHLLLTCRIPTFRTFVSFLLYTQEKYNITPTDLIRHAQQKKIIPTNDKTRQIKQYLQTTPVFLWTMFPDDESVIPNEYAKYKKRRR